MQMRTANEANKHVGIQRGTLSITTSVSLHANDVQGILHRQVSLPAVNHIYVLHKAMKSGKYFKIHLWLALKM